MIHLARRKSTRRRGSIAPGQVDRGVELEYRLSAIAARKGATMSALGQANFRTQIDTLAWLIEEAFQSDVSESLIANLRDIRDDEWTALPPGGGRSIADILEHVGWAKWMYADYAFGSASLRGDQLPLIPANGARSRPPAELMA